MKQLIVIAALTLCACNTSPSTQTTNVVTTPNEQPLDCENTGRRDESGRPIPVC